MPKVDFSLTRERNDGLREGGLLGLSPPFLVSRTIFMMGNVMLLWISSEELEVLVVVMRDVTGGGSLPLLPLERGILSASATDEVFLVRPREKGERVVLW